MSKLLTLNEAIDADILWYESYYGQMSEYGVIGGIDSASVTIYRLGRQNDHADARDYGVSWRCWDKKPTDEERKSVAWLEHRHGCWDCINYDWNKEACTINWNNLDPCYYNPNCDDRYPYEYCSDHDLDSDAEWDDDFAKEGN